MARLPYQLSASASGMAQIETVQGAVNPVQVSAEILKALAARASHSLGAELDGVVITVPAYFNDAQRQATKDAARLAGLHVLRLLNEPTAAAVAYGLDSGQEGLIAVYDLGGGTFDISILRLHRGVFEVLATGGDSALGGDDFDHQLADWLLAQAEPSTPLTAQQQRQLLDLACTIKQQLTDAPVVSAEFLGWQGTVSRELFGGLIEPLVKKTLQACRRALKDAQATADLVPYVGNARTHPPKQIIQIADSMERFGFTIPMLVAEDGTIIAGHGRLLAAQHLGFTEVPVMVARGWSDEDRRLYTLADNRLAESSEWDTEMLRLEVDDLLAAGHAAALGDIGFSADEIAALLPSALGEAGAGLIDDDEAPGLERVAVTRPGDVWVMGKHRLICGDSTSPEVMEILCDGDVVNACWTDPPYNVAYSTAAGSIANDDLPDADFRAFLLAAFRAAASVMAAGAPIYVAHADTEGLNFRAAFTEAGFKLSGCLVWVKPTLVLGRSDYQWRHEPILYGWKPGAAHPWHGGRRNTTVADDGALVREAEDGAIHLDVEGKTLVIRGRDLDVSAIDGSIIRIDKPKKSADHPTMKPVSLIVAQLRNSARAGDVVLDPFRGSGSTLIACQRLRLSARLAELSPLYCDVIVRRWQEYTGGIAVHGETGRQFGEADGP